LQEEMMHMTKGWSGLRTAVIALSLFAWTTTGVKAAAMPTLLDYSTAGTIGTAGVSGANVISFVPIGTAGNPYGVVDPTSSNIALGSFQVAPLPGNQSTTYTNTPFQINFIPYSYGGTVLAPASGTTSTSVTPVTLSGVLNGTVTGNYSSTVQVSFNPLNSSPSNDLPFKLGNGVPTALVPAQDGGTTTLESSVNGSPNNESPAPEPSTIALFLSTLGGLGLRRYVLSRRKQNKG
jgi:hypothetical protein